MHEKRKSTGAFVRILSLSILNIGSDVSIVSEFLR
jgi:hypothetical protein